MTLSKGFLMSLIILNSMSLLTSCTSSSEESLRKGWWKISGWEGSKQYQSRDVLVFDSSYKIDKDTLFASGTPLGLFSIEERRISNDAVLTIKSFDGKSWVQYTRK